SAFVPCASDGGIQTSRTHSSLFGLASATREPIERCGCRTLRCRWARPFLVSDHAIEKRKQSLRQIANIGAWIKSLFPHRFLPHRPRPFLRPSRNVIGCVAASASALVLFVSVANDAAASYVARGSARRPRLARSKQRRKPCGFIQSPS